MKILFIKNVGRQGTAGEVKEVAQGFGQHLINNGQAIVATDAVIKQNQKKIEETKLKSKGEESMAFEIGKRVDGKVFPIKGGANNKGSLYKAVHKIDVLDAISKEIVVTVPEYLIGDVNIKLTGKHLLKINYKGKEIAKFEIEIV
jgi:large subunit ribosomal protein L9